MSASTFCAVVAAEPQWLYAGETVNPDGMSSGPGRRRGCTIDYVPVAWILACAFPSLISHAPSRVSGFRVYSTHPHHGGRRDRSPGVPFSLVRSPKRTRHCTHPPLWCTMLSCLVPVVLLGHRGVLPRWPVLFLAKVYYTHSPLARWTGGIFCPTRRR